MSDMLEHLIDVVKVHIVGDDTKRHEEPARPKQPKEVRATFRTFLLSSTAVDPAVMILPHTPTRRRAVIQFAAAGPVTLAPTKQEALNQGNNCATWASGAAGPIILENTGEVWACSTQAGVTTVSVIAEYNEP